MIFKKHQEEAEAKKIKGYNRKVTQLLLLSLLLWFQRIDSLHWIKNYDQETLLSKKGYQLPN